MKFVLSSIEDALNQGVTYLALVTTLTIPDLAAAATHWEN